MKSNKDAINKVEISVDQVETYYKVGGYDIMVRESEGHKTDIAVLKDHNLITSYEGWNEAISIAQSITLLLASLTANCAMCDAYQDNKVNEFCPKHQ